ncbi:MAG: TM0106 family RecB-like putative nuclease [Thainema sp.]
MSVSPQPFNDREAESRISASYFPLRSLQACPSSPPSIADLFDLPTTAKRWITHHLLFHFQRCDRRAFLDLYGDPQQQDPPSDYLAKIKQDSIAHRQAVFEQAPIQRPQYQQGDWLTGAEATFGLMQQGAERIAQAVLISPGFDNNLPLVSVPDLLIKQPGTSIFGDWYYVPADIRYGKRPKRDYQITAAFHAHLLAAIQRRWPEQSWLILREQRWYAVNLEDVLPRLYEVLESCIETIQTPHTAPEVFIAHNRCDLCRWYSHCYETAIADRHLSLVPGVTPSRYTQLQKLGITTLADLAATSPALLTPMPGFGAPVAHKMVDQARASLENRAIAHTMTSEQPHFPLAPKDLPTANVELYFDIESAPEHDLVYLHGVLEVNRAENRQIFHALLAETAEEEEQVWQDLLDLFDRHPYAPIYHFCPYEAQTMRRLAEKYNASPAHIDWIVDRFVDLHQLVTTTVTLPVESYALKHIARWIGFDWRDADANGAQSICWYANWLETCDRTYLEAILRYNEDDCRATYHLKDWLVGFAKQFWLTEHERAAIQSIKIS